MTQVRPGPGEKDDSRRKIAISLIDRILSANAVDNSGRERSWPHLRGVPKFGLLG
jgi:hypothetical protein